MTTRYELGSYMDDAMCEIVANNAATALFEYCRDYGLHYTVVGSSGGLDSALTLKLAQRACKIAAENGYRLYVVGVTMPCESSGDSLRLGRKAIRTAGAVEAHIGLTEIFQIAYGTSDYSHPDVSPETMKGILNHFAVVPSVNDQVLNILRQTGGTKELAAFDHAVRVSQGNLKARLRMMFGVYHIARVLGSGIVLSTDNYSEFWTAFWTICGDVGDFGMIQKVLKGTECYQLARYLDVDAEILAARPDDGLNIGRGDADQLGASYPVIDQIVITQIKAGVDIDDGLEQLDRIVPINGVDRAVVEKIMRRVLTGVFKRKGTIILERENLGLPQIKDIITR